METLQSLRDKIKSVKKTNSEAGVDQISVLNPKPGPSKQPDLQKSLSTNLPRSEQQTIAQIHGDRASWSSLATTVHPDV